MSTSEKAQEALEQKSFTRMERIITQASLLALMILLLVDVVIRRMSGVSSGPGWYLPVQVLLLALHVAYLMLRYFRRKMEPYKFQFLGPWADVLILLLLLVSLRHMGLAFLFVLLLPMAAAALSQGFQKALPLLFWAFGIHTSLYVLVVIFSTETFSLLPYPDWMNPFLVYLLIPVQYFVFLFFCRAWGAMHEDYRRSEEENVLLLSRLGDKYVQLEETRQEMQVQYDQLRRANVETERSNRKLTDSLAEFYTIQQISQAIRSIFDMNELLKFVNDVIIGVMGVSNSTIALRSVTTSRMKVLVSSIFDRRELAVFTDYINHDILAGDLSTTQVVLDNQVQESSYRFVEGRQVSSIVCVPLASKGNTLGIVLVEQVIPDAFNGENVRLLEILAQQVSVAIDNARLYQQMQEMATVDGLSGAFNRIHFQNQLHELFEQTRQEAGDLALVFLDIDHFKRFNDTHGHQFGDLVLKSLTVWMQQHLRKSDLFARYGGEEFVVLMPHTNLAQAVEKADELREGLSKMVVSDRVISASVTVSMGVAAFPESAGTEVLLIKEADDALYRAKGAGRNCVQASTSSGKSME